MKQQFGYEKSDVYRLALVMIEKDKKPITITNDDNDHDRSNR